MTVRLDAIMVEKFESAESFGQAMKLLYAYCEALKSFPTWDKFQDQFLDRLDDETGSDSALLQKAIDFKRCEAEAYGCNPENVDFSGKSVVEHLRQFLVDGMDKLGGELLLGKLISIELTESFKRFIEDNEGNWKGDGDSSQKYSKEIFPLFFELTGDISTVQLTLEHVNRYKAAVLKLPKNRYKKAQYRGLTINDILGMDIPDEDRLSLTTKSNYLRKLSTFLVWLNSGGYASLGLDAPLHNVVRKKTSQREERSAYSNDDLKRLFNSDHYTLGLHRAGYMFWVPLIALYSGARINEICQLELGDIYQDAESKIWVIDINEDDPTRTLKSLKRPFHRRLIPIHSELVRLGLLRYIEQLKRQKQTRLFPDLPYKQIKNKYADKAMKWFNNTYTNDRNCNIQSPKTSFHSIRHSVLDNLDKLGRVDLNRYAKLFGQSPVGNEAQRRYVKDQSINECKKCIQKINFSAAFDVSIIKAWEHQQFGKRMLKPIT